jgi:hypothetical protein
MHDAYFVCNTMRASSHRLILLVSLAFSLVSGSSRPVVAAVRPTDALESPALPEIWQKVPAQQRLMALRAAEVDGTRLLLERIMGLHTSSDTTVRDLTLSSDTVRGMLSASIKGVTSSEPPQYFPDGRVEVVRAVKVQQVIEVLNRVIQQQKLADGSTKTIFDSQNKELVQRDEKLDVVGSSALPGSEGLTKIRAKRAAEADAYRKLGERILGVRVTSDTTVRDLALKNDEVVKTMAGVIKGAESTAIQFQKDGSCEVTMQLKLGEVLKTVTRVTKGKVHTEDSIDAKVISETGVGTAEQTPSSIAETGSGVEEVQISETLRRVVSEKPLN